MNQDRNQQWLEAALDEVVGGVTPPDLTEQIIRSWKNGETARDLASRQVRHQSTKLDQPAPVRLKKRQPFRSAILAWSGAIGSVAALALLYVVMSSSSSPGPKKVDDRGSALAKHNTPKQSASKVAVREQPRSKINSGAIGHSSELPSNDTNDPEPPFAITNRNTVDTVATPSDWQAPEPVPEEQVVGTVNALLADGWREHQLRPASPASDAEWCRRVFLRLVGRIPSVDELTSFTQASAPDKRHALVESLLASDDYVRNWSNVWANILIGRTAGTAEDDLANRESLVEYLANSLRQNKSFDTIVRELLTATGSNRENGAVNFLLAGWNKHATLATSRTSRVFLGRQIGCAQCHNHPTNDRWGQNQFWELNAFFRQIKVERTAPSGDVMLVDADVLGDGKSSGGEIYYEQRDGQMKVAFPMLDGRAGPKSGSIADGNRRSVLADFVVHSPDLPKATVNRMWAHFLGYGFTRVVDDLGPHSPNSNPKLLDTLAGQFAAHGYDLKQLSRWIALSDAFGASSKVATGNVADAPEAGTLALFSRYYSRQMQPEEVFDSLQLVARASKEVGPNQRRARLDWLGQFARNMATDEGDEVDQFRGDIRQSVALMTGPLMQGATSLENDTVLRSVIESKLSLNEKVEHLFLAAVARKPEKRELNVIRDLIAVGGAESDTLQDVWWALLNSNEFIVDH